VNWHLVPSHDETELGGVSQGVQAFPQLAVSLSETQLSWQLCVPAGQLPSQALAISMHAPLQSLLPVGHSLPHFEPSHVALPPLGIGHGEQPAPHVIGSVSLAQMGPQA
jgi:hypothetical protein